MGAELISGPEKCEQVINIIIYMCTKTLNIHYCADIYYAVIIFFD